MPKVVAKIDSGLREKHFWSQYYDQNLVYFGFFCANKSWRFSRCYYYFLCAEMAICTLCKKCQLSHKRRIGLRTSSSRGTSLCSAPCAVVDVAVVLDDGWNPFDESVLGVTYKQNLIIVNFALTDL
jgi:hypothetical protein